MPSAARCYAEHGRGESLTKLSLPLPNAKIKKPNHQPTMYRYPGSPGMQKRGRCVAACAVFRCGAASASAPCAGFNAVSSGGVAWLVLEHCSSATADSAEASCLHSALTPAQRCAMLYR
jgi:hypothetical protein